jgi:tetrahydromethanopterin S-methyltransferase subunit A
LNCSLFVWLYVTVDVVEKQPGFYNKEPLLLQMEKEVEDEVTVPGLSCTIKLLLRRTLQRSVLYSTTNVQYSIFNAQC